jgi:hypothetical protein
MKTEKIDFREVVVLDLMDNQILLPTNYQRDFGNSMYVGNNGIEQADLGRKIFYAAKESKELLLDASELELLIGLYDLFPFLGKPLHNGIKDYLIKKLENLNKEEDGNTNK